MNNIDKNKIQSILNQGAFLMQFNIRYTRVVCYRHKCREQLPFLYAIFKRKGDLNEKMVDGHRNQSDSDNGTDSSWCN